MLHPSFRTSCICSNSSAKALTPRLHTDFYSAWKETSFPRKRGIIANYPPKEAPIGLLRGRSDICHVILKLLAKFTPRLPSDYYLDVPHLQKDLLEEEYGCDIACMNVEDWGLIGLVKENYPLSLSSESASA